VDYQKKLEMKNRNLIVVLNAYKNFQDTEQSILSIRNAAHRWDVDFYEMCFFRNSNSPSPLLWDRIWALENFKNYDKVLVLDADIIINENSPNIFEFLDNSHDLCVVKNVNEDRIDSEFLKQISDTAALLHGSIELFQKKIPNFDSSEYLENYFNMGVLLYRPKSLEQIIEHLKYTIFSDEELLEYCSRKKSGDWYHEQNLVSAFFLHSTLKIKFLPKEWNWLCPDITSEFTEEFFLGPMKPFIYHFTGTNLAKERLKTYTKWKSY
jgi:lipopolysaccharide biosynthesis glycosyltransferase